MIRIVLLILTCAFARGATQPLHSIAEVQATNEWFEWDRHPILIEGVCTSIDTKHRSLVLQDGDGALRFVVHDLPADISVGQKLTVSADDARPVLADGQRYPLFPDVREELEAFESAADNEAFYVARFRGFVRPPTTGKYRFAIASDDSSVLLLGTTSDPKTRRIIAHVKSYTRPRDWTRTASQQSEAILLEAGREYYIEAVHQQASGEAHLSVAWEGPSGPLQLLAGPALRPWRSEANNDSEKSGRILREVWRQTSIDDPAALLAPRKIESAVELFNSSIRATGPAAMPSPAELSVGQSLEGKNLHWLKTSGTISYIGESEAGLRFEISDRGARAGVIVANRAGIDVNQLRQRHAAVLGVGEASAFGERPVLDTIYVNSGHDIKSSEATLRPEAYRDSSIAEINASPASFGSSPIRFFGRFVRSEEGNLLLRNDGTFRAYISTDGKDWNVVGPAIEMNMPAKAFIGIAVNSRSANVASRATFSNVTGWPRPPVLAEIGKNKTAGKLELDGDRVDVFGVGHDIWDTPDQFTYACSPIDGDGTLVAKLDHFTPADPNARAGLMVRDGLEEDSQFVDLVQTAESGVSGVSLQWRRKAEGRGQKSVTVNNATGSLPPWLKLQRRTEFIEVQGAGLDKYNEGEELEVIGYINPSPGHPLVRNAWVRRRNDSGEEISSDKPWRPLVNISKITDAPRRWDGYDFFRMRGVVTFNGDVAGRRYFALQDSTGAALLQPREKSNIFDIKSGNAVEVCSYPGWFPPTDTLFADNVFPLGSAQLPAPIRHPAEYTLTRRGEGMRIELEGVVRDAPSAGTVIIKSSGETFSAVIAEAGSTDLRQYIDSYIRARGVIVFPNERERLLLISSLEQIEMLRPAALDPFERASEAIETLTAATLLNQALQRTRVSGIVTWADGNSIVVQDGSAACRVELEKSATAKVSEAVTVVGFPEMDEHRGVILRNALIKAGGEGRTILPMNLDSVSALPEQSLFRLVRVEGTVADVRSRGAAYEEITLVSGSSTVQAVLPSKNHSRLPSAPPGTKLRVTGIATLDTDFSERGMASSPGIAPALRVLLRDVDDVAVLAKPRWWVVKRTLLTSGILTLLGSMIAGWIYILRRRVKHRTAELHSAMEKLEREARMSATLAERDRLAGEIHDSLEQGLNGLLFHLESTRDLATCPPEIRKSIELARNMASFSRTEVQHAVWELQSPMLEDSDLPTAIEKVMRQITPDSVSGAVRVEGSHRALNSAMEHHLLRIAQEAMNNTVKHAGARNINIVVKYTDAAVTLTVSDDGCGFDPTAVRTGGLGHFGLRSLRSRVSKIGGEINIISSAGNGTIVQVSIPTSSAL